MTLWLAELPKASHAWPGKALPSIHPGHSAVSTADVHTFWSHRIHSTAQVCRTSDGSSKITMHIHQGTTQHSTARRQQLIVGGGTCHKAASCAISLRGPEHVLLPCASSEGIGGYTLRCFACASQPHELELLGPPSQLLSIRPHSRRMCRQ